MQIKYIILAKIENIPIVRAAGDAHAWNKIYINNKWYGVDATHGDVGISGINASYLTYNNFLFTDDFKESQGFTDDQYGELRANNIYNYYDEVSYRYNFTEFDFQINNQNELTLLFLYIKDKISMISQFSVEFTIDNSYVVKDMYTFLETSIDESNLNVSNMAYAALEYSTGQTVYLILLS